MVDKLQRALRDRQKLRSWLAARARGPVLATSGYCPICERDVRFVSWDGWLRDHYRCTNCGSIPRERALMLTIERFFPNWQDLVVHESSPSQRGASVRLARDAPAYVASQYYPDKPLGTFVDRFRCENLEALTFEDETIDLHVTQDVFEHVLDPRTAFQEIARTLRPGGAHVFTVPIVNKHRPSLVRARASAEGGVTYLEAPVFHGNPISDEGSLVTMDWGFDICQHIFDATGHFTHVVHIDDVSRGIRAEYIEVLVTHKPGGSANTGALS